MKQIINSFHLKQSPNVLKRSIANSYLKLVKKHIPQINSSISILREQSGLYKDNINKKQRIKRFETLVRLRCLHYPLQYICGYWPFRTLNLKMKRPILIPRYQTQTIIDILIQVLDKLKKEGIVENQIKFIEFGCGSGAIGLSILKQISNSQGILIDINESAVNLTKINLKLNNINPNRANISVQKMQQFLNNSKLLDNVNLLISNPPYICKASYQKLQRQIKLYEDPVALIGGENGLYFINTIINHWNNYWKINNSSSNICILLLEYGGEYIANAHIIKDNYGRNRYILDIKSHCREKQQKMNEIINRMKK